MAAPGQVDANAACSDRRLRSIGGSSCGTHRIMIRTAPCWNVVRSACHLSLQQHARILCEAEQAEGETGAASYTSGKVLFEPQDSTSSGIFESPFV